MSQDYLARIAAQEDALCQKGSQLSLVVETAFGAGPRRRENRERRARNRAPAGTDRKTTADAVHG